MTSPHPPAELRFLPLLESLTDVVWMASVDGGTVRYCNAAFEAVYGRTGDELQADPGVWLDAVHPDDRELAERSIEELARTGVAQATYRIVRPDGETRWIDDRKFLIAATPNGEDLLGGIARDVTAAKQAQQLARLQQTVLRATALREDRGEILETLCREIEEIVPQAVATVLLLDEERRLRVAAAPGCEPALASAIDGLIPGNNVGSCGTAAYTGVACIVDDTATDPRWQSLREAANRFGIRSCWSNPIQLPGECIAGTIAISSFVARTPTAFHRELLDTATRLAGIVVQHDRVQHDLLAATESAESATKAKSELLANVSHELRTPLAAILGFTDLVLEDDPDEYPRDQLQTIQDNGEHLLKVIGDLLDVSKVETGELQVEDYACSIREVLSDTVRLFEHTIRERGLGLDVAGADQLPRAARTDPTRLRQILVNLVSNAVKFTEAGEISIRCSATPLDGGLTRLQFVVTDSGIGMPAEQLERIFSPFNQADPSMTRRFGGTGLGLSLSRQLAKLLGGDISVESAPGRGSAFTLRVVVGSENSAARTAPSRAGAPEPTSTPAELDCRVLVVEDTPSICKLTEVALRRAGAEVVVVNNGLEACETVAATAPDAQFDLVLMDMHMPIMDGYEATRALRSAGFGQPIAALTARAQTGDREACLAAGCDAYASKPLRPTQLVELVAALTARD